MSLDITLILQWHIHQSVPSVFHCCHPPHPIPPPFLPSPQNPRPRILAITRQLGTRSGQKMAVRISDCVSFECWQGFFSLRLVCVTWCGSYPWAYNERFVCIVSSPFHRWYAEVPGINSSFDKINRVMDCWENLDEIAWKVNALLYSYTGPHWNWGNNWRLQDMLGLIAF